MRDKYIAVAIILNILRLSIALNKQKLDFV